MDFLAVINSVGFPIAACLALGIYINQKDKATREDNQKDKELLMDEIKYNREVNAQLLETNKLLTSSIKIDLSEIKQEIKDLSLSK